MFYNQLSILHRWKECVHSMSSDKENGMTVAVSSMYIRRYFQGGLKVQVESLVQTVVDAFKDTINKVSNFTTNIYQYS